MPGSGDEVDRCRRFLEEVLEAIQGVVPAVKPQIAFFEQMGPEGVALYFDMIRRARQLGFFVIGDIKRSDIGSTAKAYAKAHFCDEELAAADAVTLSPYLGLDSIAPFLDVGRKRDRGVFVLARTSNPSARDFQDLRTDGQELYLTVGATLEQWGASNRGERGFTDVGAVVGATHPEEANKLRALLPQTFFLVPGYGAQGAGAADVVGTFRDGRGALISSSRGVLFATRGTDRTDHAQAAREAAETMNRELRDALSTASQKAAPG